MLLDARKLLDKPEGMAVVSIDSMLDTLASSAELLTVRVAETTL
jgi:hypothetical protein